MYCNMASSLYSQTTSGIEICNSRAALSDYKRYHLLGHGATMAITPISLMYPAKTAIPFDAACDSLTSPNGAS